MIERTNLSSKFSLIPDHWNPRIAGKVNGCLVKLVKFKGEFVWHSHPDEDEMFLVVRGSFTMRLRPPEKDQVIREGEFIIIPRGVEHMPVAEDEVDVLLFEPDTTLNTGNVRSERTRERLERI